MRMPREPRRGSRSRFAVEQMIDHRLRHTRPLVDHADDTPVSRCPSYNPHPPSLRRIADGIVDQRVEHVFAFRTMLQLEPGFVLELE